MSWWNRKSKPEDEAPVESRKPDEQTRYKTAFCCEKNHVQSLTEDRDLYEAAKQKQICAQCGELCRPAIFRVVSTGRSIENTFYANQSEYFLVRYLDEPTPVSDDDVPF